MSKNENKMRETEYPVDDFLETVSDKRKKEAQIIIEMMRKITKLEPKMWGDSIIGFGTEHYIYDSGREGDQPLLAFSPRKAKLTIYFDPGFDAHGGDMEKLGKYKTGVSCLYINKIEDVDKTVLEKMLKDLYKKHTVKTQKIETIEEYIKIIPKESEEYFFRLRKLIEEMLPSSEEVLSYGIIGYKLNLKRPSFFISAWKDHVALYPLPKDKEIQKKLKNFIKGKSTVWISLKEDFPEEMLIELIEKYKEEG